MPSSTSFGRGAVAKPVRTTPEADVHILELDAWWRAHRDKAPELFEQELSIAFKTISAAPHVGKRYHHPEADVRRVLMRTTRKHVYYVERDDHVLVVAVWGAVTDGGPDLASMSTDSTD
jgi:plasmid stabilization system protein ParE